MEPKMDFSRQLDILSPNELKMPVTVIGSGGTGSPVIMLLAKMGCTDITVFDPDVVERHNLPNQMFWVEHVGKPKVQAIAEIVKAFSGVEIKQKQEKYKGKEDLSGLVISCVDDIEERKAIWPGLKMKSRVDLYIDTRMGGLVGSIYPVKVCDPDSIKFYESTLHDKDEVAPLPCTAQAIIFNTFMVASVVGALLRKHIKNEEIPPEINLHLSSIDIYQTEL